MTRAAHSYSRRRRRSEDDDSSDGGDRDTEKLIHSSRQHDGYSTEAKEDDKKDSSEDTNSSSDSDSEDSNSSSESDDNDSDTERQQRRDTKDKRKKWLLYALISVTVIIVVIIVAFLANRINDKAVTASSPSTGAGGQVGTGEGGGSGSGVSTGSAVSTGSGGNSAADSVVDSSTSTPSTAGAGGVSSVTGKSSGTASSKSSSSSHGGATAPAATSHPASSSSKASSSGSASAPASTSSNTGKYKLVQNCAGTSFFDCFDFFTAADPTHGQVTFVGQADATTKNLITSNATAVTMRADDTSNLAAGAPRDSIRITSKQAVKINSLILIDLTHMPWGCATWPAFWTLGATKTWPTGGEIDIIEGVNDIQTAAQYSLHTADSGCKQGTGLSMSGSAVTANNNCDGNAAGNTGCSYKEKSAQSFGKPFNDAGGGVFATYFATDALSFWFWPRGSIPANINSPDVSTFGTPSATWPNSACKIAKYFEDQTIVFDLTLCGDWAGASGVWDVQGSSCGAAAATCSAYVATGSNFKEAYWDINYVKVYTTA